MNLTPEKLASLLQSIAAFNAALKTQLGLKLGINEKAGDTSKFEGKTLAEVTAEINAATGAEIDALELIVNAFIARRDNPHAVTKAQVNLGNVDNYGTATGVEAAAGVAADKFVTPAGIAAFWAGKVGAAPETLDTIAEIAAALQNNPDVINELLTAVGGKLGKTEQAADSLKLGGKTLAEVIAQAQGGVDLSNVVQKDDDFGAYKVGAETFTQILAGIQTDLDAVEALIPEKATSEDVTAGTDDVKYVTVLGVKAAASAAIDALIDGAPDALNTLNELAVKLQDQDDAVAAIVSSLADKLGKLETAADSLKFGGKTVAERNTERDAAISAITTPLAGRVTVLEGLVSGGTGDILTSTSDLAVNPVSVVTVVGEAPVVLSLKEWLEGIFAAITANGTAANAAQSAADAAALLAQAGVDAAGVADGKAVTAQAAAEAAQAAADALETSKLDVDGVAADSSKLEGQTLAQILATIRGGDIQTIQAVQDALDAYIATAPVVLTKATSVEAIAGTDDAKYITALALKAKVDDAIAALVDGAPTALDTLKELADKLAEDGDALAALVTAVDGKLGKLEQAADSAKLGGKTLAELTASAAEVEAGVVADKFVTPATLEPRLAAIEAGNGDLEALVTQMTQAFNDAADDIDPAA